MSGTTLRLRLTLSGVALAAALAIAPAGAAFAQDQSSELPMGEGRDLVEVLCDACHSLKLVTQQRLSRDSWSETLVWMVEDQGMPELDAESEALILDYLEQHYGADVPR